MQSVLTVSSKQLGFQSFPRLQRVAIWVVLPRWIPPTSYPELSKPTVTWLSLFRSTLITSPVFYLLCQLFFSNRLYLFPSLSLSLPLFLPSVSARVEVALLSIVLFSVTSFPLEFCLYAACVCVCYLCVTFFCFIFKSVASLQTRSTVYDGKHGLAWCANCWPAHAGGWHRTGMS